MSDRFEAREALIMEAIGEASRLIDKVEGLELAMGVSRQALADINAQMVARTATFMTAIAGLTEAAKVHAVKHIVARTDASAAAMIEQHRLAAADAVRTAMGSEFDAMLRRLQLAAQALINQRAARWVAWMTHAASASIGACAATIALLYWLR